MTPTGGVGVADIERRCGLSRALQKDYSKVDLRKYADRLRAYARSLPAGDTTRANLDALLKGL